MALERTYTINLRSEIIKVAPYQRSKKAITGIVAFISRHMKQPDENKIRIGQHLNLNVWKHGIRNPPVRVKVTAIKDDSGIVKVELFGAPKEVKVDEKSKKETKSLEKELEQKLSEKVEPKTVEKIEPKIQEKVTPVVPEEK